MACSCERLRWWDCVECALRFIEHPGRASLDDVYDAARLLADEVRKLRSDDKEKDRERQ